MGPVHTAVTAAMYCDQGFELRGGLTGAMTFQFLQGSGLVAYPEIRELENPSIAGSEAQRTSTENEHGECGIYDEQNGQLDEIKSIVQPPFAFFCKS